MRNSTAWFKSSELSPVLRFGQNFTKKIERPRTARGDNYRDTCGPGPSFAGSGPATSKLSEFLPLPILPGVPIFQTDDMASVAIFTRNFIPDRHRGLLRDRLGSNTCENALNSMIISSSFRPCHRDKCIQRIQVVPDWRKKRDSSESGVLFQI